MAHREPNFNIGHSFHNFKASMEVILPLKVLYYFPQ
jgi:hypothetical protein